MSLVELTSVCSVDPERVSAVFIQPRSFETGNEAVVVSMENGDKFRVEPGYSQSIYEAKAAVEAKLRGPEEA